jgi:hypothetical protein
LLEITPYLTREEHDMSTENEPKAASETSPQYDYDGHIMRTPDEWCRIHQIEILDADGWRGYDAKDWNEPLTELDFMERANVCTQRSTTEHHTGTLNLTGEGNKPQAVTDDLVRRASFTIAEHRTAGWSELPDAVKVIEAASYAKAMRVTLEAAYPSIRQHVAEQVAAKADQIAEQYQASAVEHRDLSDRETEKGKRHMRTAHAFRNKADGAWAVAHAAREIGGGQ